MRTRDEGQRKVLAKISADIALFRQSVIAVGLGEGEVPFLYTVGRSKRGLPELLLFMVPPESGQSILNELDRLMPEKRESGSLVSLGGEYPVKVIDADARAFRYTKAATALTGGRTYDVQQVILCDPEGKFPPDCAAPFNKQMILWRG